MDFSLIYCATLPQWRFSVIGFIVLITMAQSSRQDSLDDIRTKADTIARRASQRCSSVPNNEKVLPRNAISDLPLPFDPQGPIPEFRTAMYEAQKIAVNRAIFFSYILQQAETDDEPDMGYYFYSTLATLSSSDDKIMGSKIVFAKDMMQNNWYGNASSSLPFFGPYAFKRFNTSQMLFAIDLGSDPSFAYTDEARHITPNPWYAAWLSEKTSVDLPQPALLELKVLKDNSGMETINFFGPPVELPAIWTMPFFDCMFTDKWQLSVTAPIADLDRGTRVLSKRQAVPRQNPTGNTVNVQGAPVAGGTSLPIMASYVAAISVELDYKKIDINQCDGDTQFNTFAGSNKCKRETTLCEPLSGHGLRRGGYQCVCKTGFKYPSGRNTAFSGGEVESASAGDYAKTDAFQCVPVQGQELLASPSAIAAAAQTASVNTPINVIAAGQTLPSRRPTNMLPQQTQSQQRSVQSDNIPSAPQQQQFIPELNTPSSTFNTFLPQISRQTMSFPQTSQAPFRPNPSFAQSQQSPPPVPSVSQAILTGAQVQTPFQQPQFLMQNFNMTRGGPPQIPSFTPPQQFFNPQFQMSENFGQAPQPTIKQGGEPQRPHVPSFVNLQQAGSRLDPRFAQQFAVQEFDPSDPRFNQDLPVRRTRQAPNFLTDQVALPAPLQASDLPPPATGIQPQNVAVIQQLINKLAQENNLMFRARQMLDNLSPRNCSVSRFAEKVDLGFSQEFNRKISKQFATQARSALRLSHFLSNYLQNGIAVEGKRRNKLTENMILGEMAAMIIAEPAIGAVSMLFEDSVFPGRRFFAPTALYNKVLDELQFYHYPDNYTSFDWYRNIKTKASATRLTDFAVDIKIRVDATGSRFVDVPTQSFKALNFEDMRSPFGPFYDCFYLDKFFWFEVPFFAKRVDGSVQFGGLLSVGINPDQIDVNQCASAEEPLFRGTDRCDRQTTTCMPIGGRGFRAGGYKCVCKEGLEYPYVDQLQYFDGLAVEIEYQNKLMNFPNNYDKLKCRRPGQKVNQLAAIPSSVPTASLRPSNTPPVPVPVTLATMRTAAPTMPPRFSDENMAADNNPWIPNIPVTTAIPLPVTFPTAPPTSVGTFATQSLFNSQNPNFSFGFDPNGSGSQERPGPVPNNNFPQPTFAPGNQNLDFNQQQPQTVSTSNGGPLFGPSFNGNNFDGNQRPLLTQTNDASMAMTDQVPQNSDFPQLNTLRPNIQAQPTQFSPQFRPDLQTQPTIPAVVVTLPLSPSTTPVMTTPTTTTTTTTTTTDRITITVPTTETPGLITLGTMATLENLDELSTSDQVTTVATTKPVTKHGPTKYTVKVIKNKDGSLAADADSSSEIKRERRIQGKKNGASRRIFNLAGLVFTLLTVIIL